MFTTIFFLFEFGFTAVLPGMEVGAPIACGLPAAAGADIACDPTPATGAEISC